MTILVCRRFKFWGAAIHHTERRSVPLLDAANLNGIGVLLPQQRSTLHAHTAVGLLRVEVRQNCLVRNSITDLLEGSLVGGPWKLSAPSARIQSLQVCELCAKRATTPPWGQLTIATRERALRLIHRNHRATKADPLGPSRLSEGFTSSQRLILKLLTGSIHAGYFLLSFFLTNNLCAGSSRRRGGSGLLMHHLSS